MKPKSHVCKYKSISHRVDVDTMMIAVQWRVESEASPQQNILQMRSSQQTGLHQTAHQTSTH